jgi:hypothetical protein
LWRHQNTHPDRKRILMLPRLPHGPGFSNGQGHTTRISRRGMHRGFIPTCMAPIASAVDGPPQAHRLAHRVGRSASLMVSKVGVSRDGGTGFPLLRHGSNAAILRAGRGVAGVDVVEMQIGCRWLAGVPSAFVLADAGKASTPRSAKRARASARSPTLRRHPPTALR